MNPRQKVHLLLLIGQFILFLSYFSLAIIGLVKMPSKKEKIWFCSKILTINQIIEDNMNNTYPLEKIISENENKTYDLNYLQLLEYSTQNSTDENFKECGVLDSVGNIMYIPRQDFCPINEITNENNNNFDNSFNSVKFNNYNLFYNNQTSKSKDIVTRLIISDEKPKYISKDNFIFDNKTYSETIYKNSRGYGGAGGGSGGGGGGFGGGIGGGGGGFRYLDKDEDEDEIYGDTEMTDYILEKFKEENNIDKYYKNIYDNLYSRNYIGFENIDQINKFISIDFKEKYKTFFPNVAAIVFGIISSITFILSIVFSIIRMLYEDHPNQESDMFFTNFAKCLIIFNYSAIFLGFFLYIIIKYLDLKKDEKNYLFLKEFKADIFIEDFINYFYSKNKFEKKLAFIEIWLSLGSLLFFLLGWIVHIIVMKKINRRNQMYDNH